VNRITFKLHENASLIHIAASFNRIEILEYLYNRGGAVDSVDGKGATPLFYASCEEAISFLISHNANVNAKDAYDFSPLLVHLRENNIAAVDMLLLCKADANAKLGARGYTALHATAERGNLTAVTFMLKREDISFLRGDNRGDGILFSCLHHHEIVKLLLQVAKERDMLTKLVKMTNQNRQNVLHAFATVEEYEEESLDAIVTTTMSTSYHCINQVFNEKDKNGDTPIHLAVKEGKLSNLKSLLRYEHLMRIDDQNNDGDTTLHIAVRNGKEDMLEELLKNVIEIETLHIVNKRGEDIFTIAEREETQTLFRRLKSLDERLQANRIERMLTKQIRKAAYTVIILLEERSNWENVLEGVESAIEPVFTGGGAVLGIVQTYPRTTHLWENHKLRALVDPENVIAQKYDIAKEKKKTSLLAKITDSIAKKKKSQDSQQQHKRPGILVLDEPGGVVFYEKGGEVCVSDILRIIAFYMQCIKTKPAVKKHTMVKRDNIFEWILQNDAIRQLFNAHLIEEYKKQNRTEEVEHVTRKLEKKPSKKRLFANAADDVSVKSMYKTFIVANKDKRSTLTKKWGSLDSLQDNVVEYEDIRSDAFILFVRSQQ
jgi:ankyrin repeat protein